jgi:hypothetical protein
MMNSLPGVLMGMLEPALISLLNAGVDGYVSLLPGVLMGMLEPALISLLNAGVDGYVSLPGVLMRML